MSIRDDAEVEDTKGSKNINLFFGKEVDKITKSETNSTTSYIILQNDSLHAQLERMKRSCERASKEKDELVSDLESSEKTKTCLRGMLHNEVEKIEAYVRIVEKAEKCIKVSDEKSIYYTNGVSIGMIVCSLVILVSTALGNQGMAMAATTLNSCVVSTMLMFSFKLIRMSRYPIHPAYLNQTEEDKAYIRKAERGTEHLHSIVDEI
ncbi:hypothetical protein TetV_649 [Tetraselmis virus 1]|uniref:Uncharacterized protein n=1 Tax=Tetraselmis virus 1 TaxID=2060617 RepID=A0A2P0VPB1_9VIRU|nr:hypothetical protein QJ968_gp405 [Tetraselmis virus 1]AUF82731.1 hypothetical protein TetV_649 [Tetraselmis virus 1]